MTTKINRHGLTFGDLFQTFFEGYPPVSKKQEKGTITYKKVLLGMPGTGKKKENWICSGQPRKSKKGLLGMLGTRKKKENRVCSGQNHSP